MQSQMKKMIVTAAVFFAAALLVGIITFILLKVGPKGGIYSTGADADAYRHIKYDNWQTEYLSPEHATVSGEGRSIYDADSYILNYSGITPVTEEMLANLSPVELTYAKNEIGARHGKIFESTELATFFGSKNWYVPDVSYRDSMLTSLEISNINFIDNYQQTYRYEYTPY